MPNNIEQYLQAIVDGTPSSELPAPQSRNEVLLKAWLDGTPASELPEPQSRVEALLTQIIESGGGGGTTVEPLDVSANGTYTAPTGTAYSPVTVNVSGGGGSSVPEKDVNFYDYDGTCVNSYTKSEFANLTAMPENPSHDGLTAQGWNWSLADAQAYVAKYGMLNVGQMYTTDDGKTRIHIHLEKGRTSPALGLCPNGTVDIDWGDGTEHDTLSGTSNTSTKYVAHDYANPGDYIIAITAVTGDYGFGGYSTYSFLFKKTISTGYSSSENMVYLHAVEKIELGDNISLLNDAAFADLTSLQYITIPANITISKAYIFSKCYGIKHITIPSLDGNGCVSTFSGCYSIQSIALPNHTNIALNRFIGDCVSLKRINVPSGVQTISDNTFNNANRLSQLIIPDNVTTIRRDAFFNCTGMKEYHFYPITPPNMVYGGIFSGIPADCIIYVPYSEDHSILEAYKSATNWSTYASYMQEEPQ